MKTTIIYVSVHHHNTRRLAEVLATAFAADLVSAEDSAGLDVSTSELVGLGSGIYFWQHHAALFHVVENWTKPPKRVFLFSTAGLPFLHYLHHARLRKKLIAKGCKVVGEFCCRGWDTVGPLWLLGGINRRHPDDHDFARAREFAELIRSSVALDTD